MIKKMEFYDDFSSMLKYPLTVREAYSLGIVVGSQVLKRLESVASKDGRLNTTSYQQSIKLQNEELFILRENYNYELNYEISQFYQSGGKVLDIPIQQIGDGGANSSKLKSSLEKFPNKLNILADDMLAIKIPADSAEIETNYTCNWLQMRNLATGLISSLASFYSPGPIVTALMNIVEIMEKSTIDFDQQFSKAA